MEFGKVSIEYLTAGCNNESGIFDESDGNLLYASGKNVLVSRIPSPSGARPVTCALPHAARGRVHSCQWIRLAASLGALVASDDGFLRFYTCDSDPLRHTSWSLKSAIDLGAAVTLAAWAPSAGGASAFVVAVTVKGEIHCIDLQDGGSSHHHHRLVRSYAPKKITAVAVGLLPGAEGRSAVDYFILAALSDSNIRILTNPDGSDNHDSHAPWKEELSIAGHQNWVTSLSVKCEQDRVTVLSSSLDKTVRVWRIQENAAVGPISSKLTELVPQKNSFALHSRNYSVLADSLALGHENAVYFARFFTNPSDGSLEILSGSSDRSLIVWSRGFGGAWRTALQLGDLNGSLGTIGTDHTFAFYGGVIYKGGDGDWIVASASTGSILFWKRSGTDWIPQIPITGHTDKLESISWAPSNSSAAQFLLTASKDQTTRIFSLDSQSSYREIGRPQIHGYDLKCIAIRANDSTNTFELISGADEKVIRVFQAPKQFYRKLRMAFDEELVPESAELPALGLSNKTGTGTAAAKLDVPENEGDLVRNSLWPEVDKLYGHNQEICSLSLSADGKFMASSAKSHLAADAALRLWKREEGGKWLPTFIVPAHNLTVSALSFSPDSRLLLSVSRDRHFCLISPETGSILGRHEAHTRMIFSADWVTNDSFVTGSRDKTVKFWRISVENGAIIPTLIQTIDFENGITSLSVNGSVLGVGDEFGNVFILKLANCWSLLEEFSVKGGGGLGPADSITDLKWNPSESTQLAVASADNSIRIIRFYL